MSDPTGGRTASTRPRQLTVTVGFVIASSILLLLTVFDTLTSLRSVEMRAEITEVLTSPTGEGLGLTMSQALAGMRVGLMIAGACAAAAAVLGVYLLKPNRGARLALSILAVPILLTAPLTGGISGAVVAVATLMLWTGPARDWYAGRPVREPQVRRRPDDPGHESPWETTMPRDADRPHQVAPREQAPAGSDDTPEDRPTPPASELRTAGSSTQPGATTGFGTRPAPAADRPQESGSPYAMTQPAATASAAWGADPSAVPAPVKIACVLTWIFSGLVALLYAGMLVALVVMKDQIVDYVVDLPEWQRSQLREDTLLPLLWVGCLMFLAWALGACVLAWFTWRRHNWARWLLAASAAAAFVTGLFAFPAGILHQLAAALTIVGLFLSTSRAWFEQDRHTWQGPPQGPPLGPPLGPPPGSSSGPPQDSQPAGNHPSGPPRNQQPGGKPPVW